MYSMILMAAMTTGPDTTAFGGYVRDAIFGSNKSCSGCSGCDGRGRSDYDNHASCHGNCHGSCHGIFGGRIRSFFSFGGGCCGGSCHGARDHRDREASTSPRNSAACHGYSADRGGSCLGTSLDRGFSCMGSTYANSCYGSLPPASCFGLGLGSMTPSYPNYPDVGVPGMPGGGLAVPTPANYGASVYGYQPAYGSQLGCIDCGPGTYGQSVPGGEYPKISPPSLPTVPSSPPMPMPFERPAVPTPAPAPSVIEDRTLRPTFMNVTAVNGSSSNRGNVIVRIPRDAKLFVEGRQLAVTNGEKTFVTPPLPSDRDAIYSFRIEYVRDGETISQSKKVTIRPGKEVAVAFEELHSRAASPKPSSEMLPSRDGLPVLTHTLTSTTPANAAPAIAVPVVPDIPMIPTGTPIVTASAPEERARITVKLPPGMLLYVDGKKNERTDSTREFLTPPLKPGHDYSYVMRTEPVRGGSQGGQELKIEFRAGMALLVDFNNPSNPLRPAANLNASK